MKTKQNNPAKIDIHLLRLLAAVLKQDPLQILIESGKGFNRSRMNEITNRFKHLDGVMPVELLQRLADLIEEVLKCRSFEFIYTTTQPEAAVSKWIALLGFAPKDLSAFQIRPRY